MKRSCWLFIFTVLGLLWPRFAQPSEAGFCLDLKGFDAESAGRARQELIGLLRRLGFEASDIGGTGGECFEIGSGQVVVLEIRCVQVGKLVRLSLKMQGRGGESCDEKQMRRIEGDMVFRSFTDLFEKCLSQIPKKSERPPLRTAPPKADTDRSAGTTSATMKPQAPILVVFDVEDRGAGVTPEVLDNLTDYLAITMAEANFQVVPRARLKERLSEQKRESYRTCYNEACQIELGRELAAQKALSSRILKIAQTCQVGATLYDLRRAATEKAASAEADCSEESLLEAVKAIGRRLVGPAAAAKPIASAKPPPSPTKPPRASLLVETNPTGAEVLLNDKPAGKSPLSGNLKPGAYKVTIRLEGYTSEERRLKLEPGKESRLKVVLRDERPGELSVVVNPPGALVEIRKGGETLARGRAPAAWQMEAGSYRIVISYRGYKTHKKDVTVEHGKQTSLSATLKKPTPGHLVVKTDPEGATARLRRLGKRNADVPSSELGKTPVESDLEAGRYSVEASLDGYEKMHRVVVIEHGKINEVSFSLSKVYPMNPYKKWGHVAFWSGAGLMAFGGLAASQARSAAEDYKSGDPASDDHSRTWAGLMYAGLGLGFASVVTGIILWTRSPGDREWFEKNKATVFVESTGSGLTLSLRGWW